MHEAPRRAAPIDAAGRFSYEDSEKSTAHPKDAGTRRRSQDTITDTFL
jgi:hypothetical protein